jgi:hypothetical protein
MVPAINSVTIAMILFLPTIAARAIAIFVNRTQRTQRRLIIILRATGGRHQELHQNRTHLPDMPEIRDVGLKGTSIESVFHRKP